MPYELLEDAPTADVGFRAVGPTLDACFQSAAEAVLSVMLGNPAAFTPLARVALRVESESLDLVLVRFLEEFVFEKDAHARFLRPVAVDVHQADGRWVVEAVAEADTIDPTRHQLGADVKAVTMHRLRVQPVGAGWEATVVLDI